MNVERTERPESVERPRGAPPLAYQSLSDRALRFVGATAFVGCLYFVGIALGYLIFAGALPELRLRYFIGGVFVLAVLMRTVAALVFRAFPTRLGFGMYGLFTLIAVIQGFWFVPISNAGGGELYLSTIGDTIVASGIMAITGECLAILWLRRRTILLKALIGGAVAVSVSTITLGVFLGWSSAAEMRLLFRNESDMAYNYLALGDSSALLGLLLMGLFKRTASRLVTLVVVAIALFFAYSRTSFFLFLIASPFVLFIGGKNAERIGIAAAIAIAVGAFLTLARESAVLGPAMERMTVLLFQREADESFLARQAMLAEGVQYLKENWFIGRFLDEWWRNGVGGGYTHNWLSFWQSYGLIPFLISVLLFAGIGFALWKQLGRPRLTTGAAVALWIYAMLAIVTSRAYGWPFIWLAIGVTVTAAYARADENRIRSVLA